MMKVIPLILCLIALCTNGSLNSSNYNQTYFEDPIQESDIYEETIIGSAPNESKVSGYSQDFKEISKTVLTQQLIWLITMLKRGQLALNTSTRILILFVLLLMHYL